MRFNGQNAGNAGFTLIEALLSMLLMSIILVALATVTAQWFPGWDRGFSRVQRSERLASGLDRLVADLESAQFVGVGDANEMPLFEGTAHDVVFVRTALGPNTITGLEIVRIAEAQADGRPMLVRTTVPFAPGLGQAGAPLSFEHPVVLLSAPYRLTFAYSGPDGLWRDSWHHQGALPRAVRAEVRDAATAKVLEVSTSALIRAEVPARCATAKSVEDCTTSRPQAAR